MTSSVLRIIIAGHVDHGKSTLIGRLLADTGSLPDGKREELEAICKQRNIPFEWSFVLDAFQAERDQAVTIDTTQIRFKTTKRSYVIIDAPGHREFLKNMISGAAAADAAILVVDAQEGVCEQTRRHAFMLKLLGLKQIGVVVNKMDKAGFAQTAYEKAAREIEAYLGSIDLSFAFMVPVSAREGDMIAHRGAALDWYEGATLAEELDRLAEPAARHSRALRFPVQDVYRFQERRILVGRVESGSLRVGDTLFFSPGDERAQVTSIERWPEQGGSDTAQAGESIGITLDQPIYVERGHIASHDDERPMLSNVFRARIFWLSRSPLTVGNLYKIRFGTGEFGVSVQSIDTMIDTQDLSHDDDARSVERNMVADVTLRARRQLAIDPYEFDDAMGRIVLYDESEVAGGGIISMQGYPDQRHAAQPKSKNIFSVHGTVTPAMRMQRSGHAGGVFWLTGLSGAGKSTLALAVEQALFARGLWAYVLDGDNMRHGLNRDLGFSPEDRAENIRRVGEVAALMTDAGMVVVTAFISPYQADRDRARAACPDAFHEIYIKADLATCERRDPKGLYRKARAGEISEFTGIDAPYEAPVNPELVIDTQSRDIGECAAQIVDYITGHVASRTTDEEKVFARG